MTQLQIRFIENNLQMTNRELAQKLEINYMRVRYYIEKNGLKRTPEQLEQIRLRVAADQRGENNPNWKNGISKNHYHYKLIQKERYPERIQARDNVKKAKEKGVLKPEPCMICGTDKDIQAHHPDYSKPLDVQWLCRRCHHILERNLNLTSNNETRMAS